MRGKHPCEFYITEAERYKNQYDDLIMKIHKRIEYYEEGQYPHEVRILKSLLENKK